MAKTQFSRPPKTSIDDFLEGAPVGGPQHTSQASAHQVQAMPERTISEKPWEAARPDVMKQVALRIPEPLLVKLDYITSQSTVRSRHALIMEYIKQGVLKDLGQQ